MLYIKWNVEPVLAQIGGYSLRYYGILFVTGLVLGYWVVKRSFQKENLPMAKLDRLAIYIIVGTLVGARLGHCLFYEPGYYLSHPVEMLLPIKFLNGSVHFTGYQGLASHGGAIGVLLAIILFSKRNKIPIMSILDKVALAVPLTGAFIRLGNLMNSEIVGSPTDVPWAFIFTRIDFVPRHPAQLYEAVSYLFIFLILKYIYNHKINKSNGFIFGVMLSLLFTARLLIEFAKANQESFENGMLLNMGQLLSIPFILWGLYLVLTKGKNPVSGSGQ